MRYKFFNHSTFEIVEATSYRWRRKMSRFFCEDDNFRFMGNCGYLVKWSRHPVGRRRVNFQRGYKPKGIN